MKALTLEEHAQELRRSGDIRTADIADDILALLDLEEEVAEPYSELCADLEHYAPHTVNDARRAAEWLGNRSNLLTEIEAQLAEQGYSDCDPDDAIRNMFEKLDNMESTLEELQAIIDAQPNGKLTYDL